MESDPADLIARAASGDAGAWHALVDGFSGLVWSVARAHGLDREDAADVFQTTWLRLAEHLERIRDPARIGAWLAVTARNEAYRMMRLRARSVPRAEMSDWWRPCAELIDSATPEQIVIDNEQLALDRERARLVWSVFEQLPQRCRRLLRILMATPPPSYVEVAEALELPIGSIGPTRMRCLRTLRQALAKRGISERHSHS